MGYGNLAGDHASFYKSVTSLQFSGEKPKSDRNIDILITIAWWEFFFSTSLLQVTPDLPEVQQRNKLRFIRNKYKFYKNI